MTGLMSWWSRYWFSGGGRISAAAIRIAIAVSVLWTLAGLHGDYADVLAKKPSGLYDPVGILMLLGREVPPAWLLQGLLYTAWIATGLMLVGLLSRAATAVSLLSALTLASFEVSFSAGWSHHNNIVFLAQIAFLFAWGGDALSVDALLRRRAGRPEPPRDRYQFSIRLVQLAVALVFLNAALIKLAQGGFTLAWALSDNLRHHILARFDWVGAERTAVADWLLESPLRYRGAALLNLVSQVAPFAACFLMRRPLLRAACGALFAIEVVALGVVMDLWNPHWLPLTAVFVDWDRLAAFAREKRHRRPTGKNSAGESAPPPSGFSPALRRRLGAFVALFVAYDVVVSFAYPRIDTRLGTYPFTSFPMFSRIRAAKPYGEHQSYEFSGGRIQVDASPPARPESLVWLNGRRSYRFLHRTQDAEVLRRNLETAADLVRRRDRTEVHRVRFLLTIFQAPPHPEPARLDEIPVATIAEWEPGGSFRTLLGRVGTDRETGELFVEARPVGLSLEEDVTLVYFADDRPEPLPLEVLRRERDLFYFGTLEGRAQLFAAEISGEEGEARRYFLARHPHRGWW